MRPGCKNSARVEIANRVSCIDCYGSQWHARIRNVKLQRAWLRNVHQVDHHLHVTPELVGVTLKLDRQVLNTISSQSLREIIQESPFGIDI